MTVLFEEKRVPVQQNRVFESREAALHCATGALRVRYDPEADLAVNELFDPALMVYDERYDNSVPSARFTRYYDEIIDHLTRTYGDDGLILDVGCGKGTFLEQWQAREPRVRGLGIDPAYQGQAQVGQVAFIAQHFDRSLLSEPPSLVLCRHTLEHIPDAGAFLRGVLDGLPAGVPVFCEVPDLGWIVDNGAWWDFCYEHVNYFCRRGLQRCLQDANVGDAHTTVAFDGQYLWAEGHIGAALRAPEPRCGIAPVSIDVIRPSTGRVPVIWGMATKGVMMALRFEGPVRCVDNNSSKQGKYAPLSGVLIEPPSALEPDTAFQVVVMNPNYAGEIGAQCHELGLDFELVDATGARL